MKGRRKFIKSKCVSCGGLIKISKSLLNQQQGYMNELCNNCMNKY